MLISMLACSLGFSCHNTSTQIAIFKIKSVCHWTRWYRFMATLLHLVAENIDGQMEWQTKYYNPHCPCAPRVNNMWPLMHLSYAWIYSYVEEALCKFGMKGKYQKMDMVQWSHNNHMISLQRRVGTPNLFSTITFYDDTVTGQTLANPSLILGQGNTIYPGWVFVSLHWLSWPQLYT